jgi:hypothetical protein
LPDFLHARRARPCGEPFVSAQSTDIFWQPTVSNAPPHETLYSNTTGNNNTADGAYALFDNTTGSFNAAHGFQALHSPGA